jgi:type IV pilus assembly protein PilW
MDTTARNPIAARRARAQAGFTIVELMVAVTLSLFILAALATLFANTSVARGEIDKAARQIENGRFALQTMGDDIRHAGYYGAITNGPGAPTIWPNDPCSTSAADVRDAMGVPLQAYAAASAAPLGCLSGYKPDTGVVVVRRASTVAAAASAASGAFNIQVSGCPGDPNPGYVMDASGGTFNLHSNDAPGCTPITGAPLAGITPFLVRIYYVSCNSDSAVACGAAGADGVPTLQRVDVTPGGTAINPVVDGIENLQFGFGLDSTGPTPDGSPDLYTDVPPAAAERAASGAYVGNWRDVMSVRINLLARNIDRTGGYTDAKTYDLGTASVTPGGSFKRHAYSEVVRINNPAGRRE